jgi:RNA polymerase sigma-70 factor (ECF subfamily)
MDYKNNNNLEDSNILNDDDIRLMIAFREGDKSSFEKILIKYRKPLINFTYRFVGNTETAEDLAQEVFLKVYLSAKDYKPTAKFTTWLYRIASNLCLDYKKKRKIKTISLDKTINTNEGHIIPEFPDSSQLTPDVSIEKKNMSKNVRSALLSLAPHQELALSLRFYENKSLQEISQILHRSVPAVKLLLFRARQNLRNKLKTSI